MKLENFIKFLSEIAKTSFLKFLISFETNTKLENFVKITNIETQPVFYSFYSFIKVL